MEPKELNGLLKELLLTSCVIEIKFESPLPTSLYVFRMYS